MTIGMAYIAIMVCLSTLSPAAQERIISGICDACNRMVDFFK
jgi:hypothetical protein